MENKMIKEFILKERRLINKTLKNNGFNYEYSALISQAYNGEGFYVNHRTNVINEPITYANDIHWAYGSALIDYKFPKTSKLGPEETELGIYCVTFNKIEPRYPDFYYTLYKNNVMLTTQNFKTIFMTNLDWEIFNDLYITDAKIIRKTYFQDIDYMPDQIKEIVKNAYVNKKQVPELKKFYEAVYYGIFAQKLKKDNYGFVQQEMKYIDAYAQTGFEDIRNEQTPIAMFQAAYTRLREWKLFKKYMENVLYMNTDSIYTNKEIDLGEDKGLGYYGFEFNKKVLFIRRNAYIVLNEDDTIYKSVIGGCTDKKDDFTPEKINALREGRSIICNTKNENGELVEIELKPLFLMEYAGNTILK